MFPPHLVCFVFAPSILPPGFQFARGIEMDLFRQRYSTMPVAMDAFKDSTP
jgi:hypothetical protein